MNKQMMKWMMSGGLVALVGLTGCPSGNNASQEAPACEEVEVDGENYCVWKQSIIIETGYTCPASLRYSHVISGDEPLVVCSKYNTVPTEPVIWDIRWQLYNQAPPQTDMGSDMGADMEEEASCDDYRADYATAYASLPTGCQVDADCQFAGVNACGLANQVAGGCQIAVSSGADFSGLQAISSDYNDAGCGVQDPACAPCAELPVVCDAGACVVQEEGDRTCDDIVTDYAQEHTQLDRSCTDVSDCKRLMPDVCGLTSPDHTCDTAVNVNEDASSLDALVKEHNMELCAANIDCVEIQCAPKELACDAGVCVLEDAPARTCDDVRADYAAAYDAFPRGCQEDADCSFAGVNACGLANGVVGGCDIAIGANVDRSELQTLSQEYDSLGCNAGDPACAACQSVAVMCDQGMCVTTSM